MTEGQKETEKVVHEFRVVETEQGYRIEINGDKDTIRHSGVLGLITGMRGFMGRHGRRHRHGLHSRMARAHDAMHDRMAYGGRGYRRRGYGRWGYGWYDGPYEDEVAEQDKAAPDNAAV